MTEQIKQALNSQDQVVFMPSEDLVKIEEASSSYMDENSNTIIITIRNNIEDSQTLFTAFNDKLKFLSYFGNNWNAFLDVLRNYPAQADASMQGINTIIVNTISLPCRATTYVKVLVQAKNINNGCRIVFLASNKCKKEVESIIKLKF